jgi:hypothetical protein
MTAPKKRLTKRRRNNRRSQGHQKVVPQQLVLLQCLTECAWILVSTKVKRLLLDSANNLLLQNYLHRI